MPLREKEPRLFCARPAGLWLLCYESVSSFDAVGMRRSLHALIIDFQFNKLGLCNSFALAATFYYKVLVRLKSNARRSTVPDVSEVVINRVSHFNDFA